MRIISGKYKGRRIIAPKKLPVRPTTDLAKEALFNILNNYYYFEDVILLDLFAGTGNISFEFASRGSTNITAVDSYYGCIEFIKKTARELELPIKTVKSDVFKFLEKSGIVVDVVFADPPYNFSDDQFLKIPELIFANNILSEDGMLVVEHSQRMDFNQSPNFSFLKKYGGSVFSFFEKEKTD